MCDSSQPMWMKSSVWMVLFFRAVYACVAWRRLPLVLVVLVSFVPVLPPYACMYSRYDTWSSLLHGFGVINCNGCWLVSDSAVGLHPPRWMKSSVWMVLFFRAVYACVAWRRLPLVLVVSVSFVPVLPPYACYHDQTARLWRYACVCACVCLCATTV